MKEGEIGERVGRVSGWLCACEQSSPTCTYVFVIGSLLTLQVMGRVREVINRLLRSNRFQHLPPLVASHL